MRTFLVILSSLVVFQASTERIYEAPLAGGLRLRATVSRVGTPQFRLTLSERAGNRSWDLVTIPDEMGDAYKVLRGTSSSIIVEHNDSDYGVRHGTFAVFFDLPSKKFLKKVDFDPHEALRAIGPEEVRRIGVDPKVFDQIKNAPALLDHENLQLPASLRGADLPQSTYQEFAKARPVRVRDGYSEDVTTIEERIGVTQELDGRVWFGKTFYDGEGYSGVGGLGYFEIAARHFSFLRIPQVVDWSVSALLVNDQTLWAGLERRPEGAEFSGGLLRHNLKTSTSRIYRVEDVITSLHSSGDALVLGTANGIYVLRNDRMIRHRITPTLDGKFVFYSEPLLNSDQR
jgi:hypothetical protein